MGDAMTLGMHRATCRAFLAILVLSVVTLASAQTRVALVGDAVSTPAVAYLSKLLGPEYSIGMPLTGTKSVIIVRGDATETDYDRLVPSVKAQVREFAPRTVYVALLPSQNSQSATYLFPLLRQAARESGATIIDLSATKSDSEIAQGLYEAIVDQRITKKDWKVVFLDSYEPDEGSQNAAIDGDPNTIWHTAYSDSEPKPPHEIQIDFGKPLAIGGFRHTPRQDGGVNGRIKAYELYASDDGKTWGEPIAKGDFPNTAEPTTLRLTTSITARYIRLVALSEQNGGPWTSLAELDVLPPLPK